MLPDGSHRQDVTLGEDGQLQVDFAIDSGAIRGRVLMANGSPALNTNVSLYRNEVLVATTAIKAEGWYWFPLLAPGTYTVAVSSTEVMFPVLKDIDVAAGVDVTAPDCVAGGSQLAITFAPPNEDTQPGTGFAVIRQFLPASNIVISRIVTPVDGNDVVTQSGLTEGEFEVTGIFGGLVAERKRLEVSADTTAITIPLHRPAALRGTVRNEVGDRLDGMSVTVWSPADPASAITAVSDENGDFQMPGVLPGSYALMAADMRPGLAQSEYWWSAPQQVTLDPGFETFQDVVLRVGSSSVRGNTASAGSGFPLLAEVQLLNQNGIALGYSHATLSGDFLVDGLPAGTFNVTAEAPGFAFSVVPVTTVEDGISTGILLNSEWIGGQFALPPVLIPPSPIKTAGILDFFQNITIDFSDAGIFNNRIANMVREALAELLGEPKDTMPRLQRPVGIDDCPPDVAAQAWELYRAALREQQIMDLAFEAWHGRWEATQSVLFANIGLIGTNLLKLSGTLMGMYANMQGAWTNSFKNAGQELVSKMDEAARLGKMADVEKWHSRLKSLEQMNAQMMQLVRGQAGLLSSGIGVSFEKWVMGSDTGVEGIVNSLMNISNWSASDFISFVASGVSVLDGISNVVQGLEMLSLLSGAAPNLGPLGAIADGLNVLASSIQGIVDGFRDFEQLARTKETWEKAVKRRQDAMDKAQAFVDAHCRTPTPTPSPSPTGTPTPSGTPTASPTRSPIPTPTPPGWKTPVPTTVPKTPRPTDPPPPPPPPETGDEGDSDGLSSGDPNDKITVGTGAEGWVQPGTVLEYTIHFENMATADLPAQEVVVTDFLDENLDWSTFQPRTFMFNHTTVTVPGEMQNFTGRAFVATDSNPVDVGVTLDVTTGRVSWTMRSIDPVTRDLPEDPFAGFLPPNNETNDGQGELTFSIKTKPGLADGTAITNKARIVFDVNEPIDTNAVVNTIDGAAPVSTVGVLPTYYGKTSIPLTVDTSDAGSGIALIHVFAAVDNGPLNEWGVFGPEDTIIYPGAYGHRYSFAVMASDHAGNSEQQPTSAIRTVELVDPAETLTQILDAGGSPVAQDVNGDGVVDSADVQRLLNPPELENID
jgi:uncharacterized repeat protein (TIGR01451 family)